MFLVGVHRRTNEELSGTGRVYFQAGPFCLSGIHTQNLRKAGKVMDADFQPQRISKK